MEQQSTATQAELGQSRLKRVNTAPKSADGHFVCGKDFNSITITHPSVDLETVLFTNAEDTSIVAKKHGEIRTPKGVKTFAVITQQVGSLEARRRSAD